MIWGMGYFVLEIRVRISLIWVDYFGMGLLYIESY